MENIKKIKNIAKELGFDLVGIAKAETLEKEGVLLDENITKGYYGNMKWLEEVAEKRKDILKVMPGAKSVICVAMNYYGGEDEKRKNQSFGQIARYAYGRDYHKIFDKKLKLFAQKLKEIFPDSEFKYYSDTGPVLERAWAMRAGLGFVGKNTNLITKYGSWVLLGEVISDIDLIYSPEQYFSETFASLSCLPAGMASGSAHSSSENLFSDASQLYQKTPSKFSCGCSSKHCSGEYKQLSNCGSCRRCLDICPTGALEAPYTVNASKCISYLTIEHKGEIPVELRGKMGNWIFGCDICQKKCPFNVGRQQKGGDIELTQKPNAGSTRDLKEILSIKTDEEFLEKFAGSPVMRAKRRGLVRNACVAAGNSGDKSLIPYLEALLDDDDIVAGHAKWAIGRLDM